MGSSGRQRWLVPVLVLGLAVPLLAAAPEEPTCAVVEPAEANWGSNRPVSPNADNRMAQLFGLRTEEYLGFGVGQVQGTQAAVVDSNSLQVTRDAGCTWELGYAFDRDPDPSGQIEPSTSRFTAVAVSDRGQGDERIVALVYDLDSGFTARVRTLVSDDGGRTFEVGGAGLPDAVAFNNQPGTGCGPGRGCLLKIAPTDPDRVYVVLDGISTALYVSRDGGMTFEALSDRTIIAEYGAGYPTDLSVSRESPNRLWGAERFGDGVISSTDGGRSWTTHDHTEAMEGASVREVLTVGSVTGSTFDEVAAIVRDTLGTQWVVHSLDDGITWRAAKSNLGENVIELVGGTQPGRFIATTTDRGAFALDVSDLSWTEIGGSSLGPLSDIHPLGDSTTIWFRGPRSLPVTGDVQFTPPLAIPDLSLSIDAFDPLNPIGRLPGTLSVPKGVIALDVEESTTADVVLHLPPTPTPLDVFFLFDQSGSMSEEMEALAREMGDITNELIDRRIDLAVGLGGYEGGWRYQLHRDIGLPDREFQQKLDALSAGNGGSGIETAYTAIHQVATGTGLEDSNAGKGPPPGWNAHWRHGSIRLVINITDEKLQVENFPTVDDATQAVIDHAIQVMGLVSGNRIEGDFSSDEPSSALSVDGGIKEDDSTFGPVAVLARKSGAVAPKSGMDCGNDGEIDIVEGEPLACYLSPLTTVPQDGDVLDLLPDLSDVIVEMLDNITEENLVQFFHSDSDVVTGIKPLVNPLVDIRDPQTIPARVTLTCPRERNSQVIRPMVTAVAASRILAADRLIVACGPVDPLAVAGLPTIAAAVAPAPAPLPPPAPATAAAQASSAAQAAAGAQAPAAATSMIPQVGVAAVTQQEQQSQVAAIGKTPPEQSSDPGLAFEYSARRDSSPEVPVTLLLGAAMTASAAAVARRRQNATTPTRAHVRTTPRR